MQSLEILHLIERSTTLRTAASLTRTVTHLISSGEIPPNSQLPTIRVVAEQLGMSRSAVGQTWRELQKQGLVESRRRGGTAVLPSPKPPHARRFESMIRASANMKVNLGNLWCADLPTVDLQSGFEYAVDHPDIGDPFAQPIHPEFQESVAETWPFETDSFLAMHGTIDTLEMSLAALVRPGDHVAVESPTIARIFDVLESLGAVVDSVPIGPEGPDLTTLSRALISKPVAFIYQPSRSLPTGRSVTPRWVEGAARILKGTLPILEFDQVWPLTPVPISLGTHLPEQVLHVRGFNYSFGPSMRQAVTGGNPKLTKTLWNRLSYSSRYVSPIMQLSQAKLLVDPTTESTLNARTEEIFLRFSSFKEALSNHDFDAAQAPMIWLPVPDEYSVCTQLSTKGIVVHPGAFFQQNSHLSPHVCINTGATGIGIEELAHEISEACDRPVDHVD